MNVKTMEGLLGANANINLMETPMRVYEEAKLKGEEDKMERAMGYVGDFSNKARIYNENVGEGLIEEAEEAREAQKTECEKNAESSRCEKTTEPAEPGKDVKTNADGDSAQINEEAKAYAEECSAVDFTDSANAKIKSNRASETVKAVKKSASDKNVSG